MTCPGQKKSKQTSLTTDSEQNGKKKKKKENLPIDLPILLFTRKLIVFDFTHWKMKRNQHKRIILITIFDHSHKASKFGCSFHVRARSQIPELGLTGPAGGSRASAPGTGFSGQNLRIKHIPCVGTHLWITIPAKSTLSYTKSTYVNRYNQYS